ncbi:MAG: hypothetical protein J5983_05845 [Ruminococcus sp.]|nr:hypothetical protein [Ruminococcus sp.]
MIFFAVGILILIIAAVIAVFMWKNHAEEQEKIEKGIAYLESLETKDLAEIKGQIKQIHAKYTLELAESDENAVWLGFEDAAILGDSRAVGFAYYEFLPEERVYAESGANVTAVSDHIESLKALNPGQVYLCYGLNDVKSGLWPEPEAYAQECANQIQALLDNLAGCDVYLNSILPVSDAVVGQHESYSRIGEYNEAMKAMCEEKGYHFIDNSSLVSEHSDMFQPDGLHMMSEFYKYWAANMLAGVE